MKEPSLFCQRMMNAIKKSEKSINSIERELGYPRNSLHNYINGGEPSGKRLLELAHYFQLTPEYLMGLSDWNSTVSLEQLFDELDEAGKLEVFELSQAWARRQLLGGNQ